MINKETARHLSETLLAIRLKLRNQLSIRYPKAITELALLARIIMNETDIESCKYERSICLLFPHGHEINLRLGQTSRISCSANYSMGFRCIILICIQLVGGTNTI
jgi:hypothetical protein